MEIETGFLCILTIKKAREKKGAVFKGALV